MKVSRRTFLVIAGGSLVTGCASKEGVSPSKEAVPPQVTGKTLSTPQDTLTKFVNAMEQWDTPALSRCVLDGEPFTMPEMPAGGKGPTLDCTDVVCTIEGNMARLTANVHVLSDGNLPPLAKQIILPMGYTQGSPIQETLQLTQSGSEWKIVASHQGNQGYLNYGAMLSRYYAQAALKAKENSCLSNLRQVGLACQMALQDSRSQFPRNLDTYEEWVGPYLKNDALFHCPLIGQPALRSYSFNVALAGLSLQQIPDLSRTVMLYEGEGQRLQVRHEGKSGVVCVDGHAQMLTAEEAKALIWTP